MSDGGSERQPFDVYVDQFTITLTPFGANLTFAVREPHPPRDRAPQAQPVGTVRMSVEHLKTMVVILRKHILQVEKETGVKAEVPRSILNQFGIAPEDWDSFWD